MQTLRVNLNCALRNERQYPKDFLKFNFKASPSIIYFDRSQKKKRKKGERNLFYCQYILLLDIFSLHQKGRKESLLHQTTFKEFSAATWEQ